MYNVLAKLRSGEPLTAKDKTIHETGLVAVLRQLHDELDTAVLAAYGWPDLAPTATDALLDRLVALNAERSHEEATGQIRWLRPDFQNPTATVNAEKQAKIELPATMPSTAAIPPKPAEKRPWPPTLPEQVAAIAQVLADSPLPLDEAAIAERFTGKGPWKKRLPQIVDTLEALGRVRRQGKYIA